MDCVVYLAVLAEIKAKIQDLRSLDRVSDCQFSQTKQAAFPKPSRQRQEDIFPSAFGLRQDATLAAMGHPGTIASV
ncbi:MAG: hypothetical protein NW224_05655 [Leptolyngbyaceae cyanobacterium bins.302]|nr:hypothetical protein [Leptolyngbyaceae cyanobacterium bins.302]